MQQVRAFVKNVEGTAKQELNQSPLVFVESRAEPGQAITSNTCSCSDVRHCLLVCFALVLIYKRAWPAAMLPHSHRHPTIA